MKKIRLYILLVWLTVQHIALAQVCLTVDAPYLSVQDTLELWLRKDYIGYDYNGKYALLKAHNENGKYHFDFDLDGLSWMSLYLDYQKGKGHPMHGIIEKFLVADGDSLTLRIIPRETEKQFSLKFYDNGLPALRNSWRIEPSGRGRHKFLAKQFLDSLVDEAKEVLKVGDELTSDAMKDLSFRNLRRRIADIGEETAAAYNAEALDILAANAMGEILEKISRDIRNGNYMDTGLPYLAFVTFEEDRYTRSELDALSRSPEFLNYLYMYFLLKKKLLDKAGHTSSVYDLIKEQITYPILKDRVTIRYMMSNFSHNPSADILRDVRSWMRDPLCLSMLDRMAGGVKGRKVEFSLPDVQDRMHGTVDLKGKVVLIDFWYRACIPCRIYMQTILRPLAAHFGNDDRFVIVTISTDDKNTFAGGLEINDFLPDRAIHLYTGGKRFKHPLLKNLGVRSYPQPFLLDKQGKIIGTKNDLKKDIGSIIELIDQHLEK